MKKLKNSVKAIIVSVVAVVVAVSTILAVVLLRKDGGNPPPTDNRYTLTDAQLDLVDAINEKAEIEYASSKKKLEVYDASRFVDENGAALDLQYISSVDDDKFFYLKDGVYMDMYYFDKANPSSGKTISPASSFDYPTGAAVNYGDSFKNYAWYSASYKDGPEDKADLIVLNLEDLSNIKTIYRKTFSTDYICKRIYFFEFGYVFNFQYTESSTNYDLFEYYEYTDDLATSENLVFSKTGETSKFNNVKSFEYGVYFNYENTTYFLGDGAVQEFDQNPSNIYDIQASEYGYLISEFDAAGHNAKYKVIPFNNFTIKTLPLDAGYSLMELNAVTDEYLYVYQKENVDAVEGRIVYFDSTATPIIAYNAKTSDDKIYASDGTYILLYNKVISTAKSVEAFDHSTLTFEGNDFHLNSFEAIKPSDFYVVSGFGMNIVNSKGEFVFDSNYKEIFEYNGMFLAELEDKFYLLDVVNGQYLEIEDFSEKTFETLSGLNFIDFGLYVTEDITGYNIYQIEDNEILTIEDNGTVFCEDLIDISIEQRDGFVVLVVQDSNAEYELTLHSRNFGSSRPVQSYGTGNNGRPYISSKSYYRQDGYSYTSISFSLNGGALDDFWDSTSISISGSARTSYSAPGWISQDDVRGTTDCSYYSYGFEYEIWSCEMYAIQFYALIPVAYWGNPSTISMSGSGASNTEYDVIHYYVPKDTDFGTVDNNNDFSKTKEYTGYQGSNYNTEHTHSKNTLTADDLKLKGATFVGWSSMSASKHTGFIFTAASSYSTAKYYAFYYGNDFGENFYVNAAYQPDVYSIQLNLMGDLPTNTIKSTDITVSQDHDFERVTELNDNGSIKNDYYIQKDICYYIPANSSTAYASRKFTYADGSQFKMTSKLPTPTVYGYTFQGWIPSGYTSSREDFIETNFWKTSVKNIKDETKTVIAPETTVYQLHYGTKKGTTQNIVQMTAVWAANDFSIIFDYGDEQSTDNFQGFVQNEVAVMETKTTPVTYYLRTIISDGVTQTEYTSNSTNNATKITYEKIEIPTASGGKNYVWGLKFGTNANVYPLYVAETNAAVTEGTTEPAYAYGTKYYVLRQYDLNQNTSLFNIVVNGQGLKGHSSNVTITTGVTWTSSYMITLATKFNADAQLSKIFEGNGTLISSTNNYLLNTNKISLTGSSSKFVGWAIQFKSGAVQPYLLQSSEITSLSNDTRLYEYMKMVNGGTTYYANGTPITHITFYAVYSVKPYQIKVEQNADVENSSNSFESGYAVKTEKVSGNFNSNITNATLINNALAESKVTYTPSTTSPEYLGSITYTFEIGNQDTNKVYYIFDKIELVNFGVKYKTGSSGAYNFYNATIVLTNTNGTWGVTAKKTSDNTALTVEGSSATYYYVGSYHTGNDANNKYNRISIISSTATKIQFKVDYLGISGDYLQGGNMTHSASSGVFTINDQTAEGGYFGFTVKPYVKSNFTKDDDISVESPNDDQDSVLKMVAQKVYEKDSKYYFWINNVQFYINKDGSTTNYYTLPAAGGICSLDDDFGTFFKNTSSNSTVYFNKNELRVYYPKQYVRETTTTTFKFDGSNATKTNYNSTAIYAIRPEQYLLYAAKNPTVTPSANCEVKQQDHYELLTYLSSIEITEAGKTFTLAIDRVVNSNASSYYYSDMSITDSTGGKVFTESYDANKSITYLGRTFKIHSGWYFTYGSDSATYKNRAFIMYLTTDTSNGEFYYFMYTDVYSSGTTESTTTTDTTIKFSFSKFDKKLELHLNDENNEPAGIDVNTNDLFDTNDKPILFRYTYAINNTVKDGYQSSGLSTKAVDGTTSSQKVAFADVTSPNSSTVPYYSNKFSAWNINPTQFVIFELQPTNGYLIKDLVIKIKGTTIVDLSLASLSGLTYDGYYTYTTAAGGSEAVTNIAYVNDGGSKYFSRYTNSVNADYISGIGYSRSVSSNWTKDYAAPKFNPIWIMISGVYDDVQIYATTTSYIEFNITDDTNNNLGYDNTANPQLSNLDKLWLVTEVGSDSIRLGTTAANDSTQIIKSGNAYRIIFLGKGHLFRKGIHIYASDQTYSSYFTDAKVYMDVKYDTSIKANPTAFERLNDSGLSCLYYGRDKDGKTLYWSGDAATGYNTVLKNSAGSYISTPNFTGKNAVSSDYLTYLYISDIQKYFGKTTYTNIHTYTDGNFEYSNKFILGMSIKKNEVSVGMNSYLYNATLTSTEVKPTSGFQYSFNSQGFSTSTNIQYVTDTTNNWKWLKPNGVTTSYCYQLDYVGLLDPANPASMYTKKSSWFNDTILTNIDKKYYSGSSWTTINSQVASGGYGSLNQNVYGYGNSYTYYEIPGYYLQYIEVITVDYGSIYIPISSVISGLADSGYKGEYAFYKDNSGVVSTGIYYEIEYITTGDPRFTIRFYQDNADILAARKSINFLSNNVTVNFYSYPYSYNVNLNAFANDAAGQSSKNTISSESTFKGYSNNAQDTTQEYTALQITYDSLAVIDRYLTMEGYTFIGWGSEKYHNGTSMVTRYVSKNGSTHVNAWNSSSKWYDIRGLFDNDNRKNLLDYFGTTFVGGLMTSFNSYDFYVKSSDPSNRNNTGYFITDTGYGNTGANQESYNFWSAYDRLFMANLGKHGLDTTATAYSIKLYAIWKANTYSMKFNVNDSTSGNGSTASSLKVTGKDGVAFASNVSAFNNRFDNNDYLYYNIYDSANGVVNADENYYCFVTYDSADWYVKKAESLAGAVKQFDLYNSYKAAGTYDSFITKYDDGYNDLKTVIDRYGYSWLGWFASKQDNEKQDAASYDTSTLVFGSKYYKMMATSDSGKNYYTYYGGSISDGGMPTLNKTLYTIFNTNSMVNEVYSQFVYIGQHKTVSALGSAYVAHYNYKSVENSTELTAGSNTINVKLYTNGDYLNTFNESQEKVANSESTVYAALTYFDTTMTYASYSFTKANASNPGTLTFDRTSNISFRRMLYLTAYWEENNYRVIVDWQDNNGNEDHDGIFTRNEMGSSPAGILQTNGTVSKEEFGTAYFDDFEVSERLNKFSPVRVGYDFLGWTYNFNESVGAVNNPSLYYLTVPMTATVEAYQVAYQNYLNNNILTPTIVLYVNGQCLQSGQFNSNRETLGDSELVDKNTNPHCVYIFALWKAQTFTINFDLNIEYEDLENLYEIDSNFAVALYDEAIGDGNYNFTGIRSDYYRYNTGYYTDIVANVNFKITFDQAFSSASCEIGGKVFYLKDLFATSAGYYFLGWLYDANDTTTLMIANSLQSMISSSSNIVQSNNAAGSVEYGFGGPIFEYNYHQTLLKVTHHKDRGNSSNTNPDELISGNGVYTSGAKLKTNTDNNVLLSSIDKHGISSNFGSITIGGVVCPIVSEVEKVSELETNYYLYFKYLGVKYYVRFYIEPNVGGARTAFTSDESYLYFKSGSVSYKVRYETDGTPYIVTSDYKSRTRFVGANRIKIAIFGQKAHTTNVTRNDLAENTTAYTYNFSAYIKDVIRKTDGSFDIKKGNQVTGSPLTFTFQTAITRQFTFYAHWEHKNDFEIVINNGNNESDVPTSNSNPGLSGFYHVENTYTAGQHNTGKDYSDLVSQTTNITEEDYGNDEGYNDENVSLTYNYYDDLNFNILPFYNGRYISEITLKFYSVTEVVKTFSQDSELMKSDYVYTTYTLVFKFKWNSDKHTIEIDNITFNNGISPENVNCGKEIQYVSADAYSKLYQVTSGGSAIKQLSIIDSQSFNAYMLKMFDYSNASSAGQVGVMNNNTVHATYGRLDVNKVAFNLTKVMSSIDITCKFSVQTYSLELHNILDDDEDRTFTHKEGVGDNNQYETTISLDKFDSFVQQSIETDGRQPFKAGEVTNATNVVTISTDCGKDIVDGYKVPYGYYIYGVFYDSSYVGYRPVDSSEANFDAQSIVTDPMYGFEWLYSNGYYKYGSTNVAVEKFETDLLYAQCSPVLGTKNKFAQAVRLEGLSNYNFVGWYEVLRTEFVTFLQYDKMKEAEYINRNITLYGYYIPINAPTSIEFYTWNDTNKTYTPYYGNKQEYTLNANITSSPFIQDDSGIVSLKQDQNDYIDVDKYAKINIYNNYGIDETGFNSKGESDNIFDGNDFGQNSASDKSMLDMVLTTYWFYYYAYDVLQFISSGTTHILRYDYARDEAGQAPFYYYTNETNKTGIIYGDIRTMDYANFSFIEEGGAVRALTKELKVKENEFGLDYDLDGSYMYLKMPERSGDVNTTSSPVCERYYRVYEIKDMSEYQEEFPSHYTTWVETAQPRFYVDVLGKRYYILPRNNTIAKDKVAKTIFDENGKTAAGEGNITPDIASNASFVNIKNYYIQYYEEYYQVVYAIYSDNAGSKFINPYYDMRTNTVELPAVGDNPTEYYFNYEKATLYYNAAPSTVEHYVYCPVNTNYKSNVAYVSSAGNASWETTGVTIKTLPSPHIGYWYDGGEEYGFVGYIQVTDKILEGITKRGDANDPSSGGEMYKAFLDYINSVFVKSDYDQESDFASTEAMNDYLNRYDHGGSGSTTARLDRAFANFIIALKEAVGSKISNYTKLDFCSNLLLADSYDYEDYATKKISYVNVNVPVSFKDLIPDPINGGNIAISISFLYKFNIITQETVIRDNLYAIPIYSPFIMDFTQDSVETSGSSITIDASEMDIWHFDIQNNATAHVYNVFSGDYVNYALLTYEQYLTLRANRVNVADYLTKMIKLENGEQERNYIYAMLTEDINTRQATFNLTGYGAGHYVLVAYYNKTGTSGETGYVARVSDNIVHITVAADNNVYAEITTMDKYS